MMLSYSPTHSGISDFSTPFFIGQRLLYCHPGIQWEGETESDASEEEDEGAEERIAQLWGAPAEGVGEEKALRSGASVCKRTVEHVWLHYYGGKCMVWYCIAANV